MKNLMKLFSILLVGCLIALIITSSIFPVNDIPDFASKLSELFTMNIIPIIIMAISSFCLQRKDENYLVRIILFFMLFSIILSAVVLFLPLKDINESLYSIIVNIYNFISQIQLYILAYSLLCVVKPNNTICDFIKKIAYIAIIASIIVQLWIIIKNEMIETLPNVYGYKGFNFASLKETSEAAYKVVTISLYVEIFSIILTYITNYAFESDTIEAENLDYDELKKQAESITKNQIDTIYLNKPKETIPDRSISEKTGLMNINNQLGANSNVGQIDDKTKLKTTFVDKSIPTSNGPIANPNIKNNENNNQNNN